MIGGVTSRPFSARTLPPLVKSGNLEIEEEVIRSSRELYCRSREDVEKEINDWSGMSLGDDNSQGGVEKFEAQCSICKNQTKVPFKPEPGRPVYCKDCITKIKAGEIKPVKVSLKQTKDEQVEFFKPLAVLGIEFPSNQIDEKIKNKNYNKINQNRYSINKKPSIFSNIKKVFNKTENIKPKRIMGENLALREVLNKTLEQNKIKEEEEKKAKELEKNIPKPISLAELKIKDKESLPPKDRGASTETMDKLKNVIESVSSSTAQIPVNEPLKLVADVGHPNSDVQNPQNAVPKPPISNIKEVPEEILKKILEE